MKKHTRVTYYVHIILMSIILAINFLGLIVNEDSSVKSIYLFNLIQSVLFLTIIILTPTAIQKTPFQFSDIFYIVLVIFCTSHFLLGEIFGFYAKVVWWDSLLHASSGVVISLLGFSLLSLINNDKKNSINLNIGISCFFAFCIAVTVGAIWEIIEFTSDSLFGGNMQRAYESLAEGGGRGEPFVGQMALMDTMKDLILDSFGSAVTCISCYVLCKTKNFNINRISVVRVKSNLKKIPARNRLLTVNTNRRPGQSETSLSKAESPPEVEKKE